MSISEHETNYTPSKWSKRFNQMEVLAYHDKFAKQISENARRTLKCEINIPYGITDRTKYDIYGSDLPKDAPIFIFIHGGYWQEGHKDAAAFAAPVFVRNGIKVITIGYDLCPQVKVEDIISQIKEAIEQILKYALDLQSRGVWISGHSAGSHLTASLLYDKSWLHKMTEGRHINLLKGFILISGIFNLTPLINTTINDNLKLTKDEIDAYSFITLNTDSNMYLTKFKVIITVGECDSPGLIKESQQFAQKLITMVDNVHYIFIRENIDHFDIVEKLTDSEFILTNVVLNNILYDY